MVKQLPPNNTIAKHLQSQLLSDDIEAGTSPFLLETESWDTIINQIHHNAGSTTTEPLQQYTQDQIVRGENLLNSIVIIPLAREFFPPEELFREEAVIKIEAVVQSDLVLSVLMHYWVREDTRLADRKAVNKPTTSLWAKTLKAATSKFWDELLLRFQTEARNPEHRPDVIMLERFRPLFTRLFTVGREFLEAEAGPIRGHTV